MQLSGFYPCVCLSVPLSHSSAAAAGLLLWVRRAGDADRSWRPPQQHGAQWHGERRVNVGSAALSADVAS